MLSEAINKGVLVPFRYYGIFDDTDYSGLHVVRGRYDEKELNETYIGNVHRHDLIYKNYCKYGSRRALGFCCSRAHAEEMASEFSKRGVPAAAVYSNADGAYSQDQEAAIENLKSGQGFFVEKEGYAIALHDDLKEIIKMSAFVEQMGDIIEYRTTDYYQRRYREKRE